MADKLTVVKREVSTNSQLKQLRSKGQIPAIVYGENIDNVAVTVEQKELTSILKVNPNAILQVELPEQGKHPVMIGQMQRDPITREIIHVDLQQINVKNPIKSFVRIDYVGKAPGVSEGGILQTRLVELEIQCLPHLIPTSIEVDVSELNIGESISVSDIKLSDDIEVLTDVAEVVASILVPQKSEGDEAAEATEATEAGQAEEQAETAES